MRKDDNTLHFTINGVDLGEAATNVPAAIYGVVDLFANAAQVTIVDHSGRATHIILVSSVFNASSHIYPSYLVGDS